MKRRAKNDQLSASMERIDNLIAQDKEKNMARFRDSLFEKRIRRAIRKSEKPVFAVRIPGNLLLWVVPALLVALVTSWLLFFSAAGNRIEQTSIYMILARLESQGISEIRETAEEQIPAYQSFPLESLLISTQRQNIDFYRSVEHLELLIWGPVENPRPHGDAFREREIFKTTLINEVNMMRREGEFAPLFRQIINKIKEVSI